MIASVNNCEKTIDYMMNELSKVSGISKSELESRADVYEDNGAIHHLFLLYHL